MSSLLQYYSSLPFNITSGIASLQGTSGRPLAAGATAAANFDVRNVAFIKRNTGIGGDFLTLNFRASRVFPVGRARLEGLVEAFNVTNRVNTLTRNATFGTGAFPTHPGSSFSQVTAVGDPRTFQFGVRVSF